MNKKEEHKINFYMNKTISFLFLVSLISLIWACNKETLVSNEKPLTETGKAVKKPNIFDPGALSLEGYTGDNVEENLESVEELLNATYCYPDQSIGAINTVETEFTITPENGSYLTETEAELLYANALSVLSEAYYDFPWEDPQSLLVDIERIETSNPSEVKVLVTAQVGELAEEGEVEADPCNPGFTTGSYQVYTPSSGNLNPSIKYAGIEMTKKFNKKSSGNLCFFYKKLQPFNLGDNAVYNFNGATGGNLTESQMAFHYCEILSMLNGLNLPAGFTIASISIQSDIITSGGYGKFTIKIEIGQKITKIPCEGGPQNVPPPNN